MSSESTFAPPAEEEFTSYRELCKFAVFAAIFAIMALLGLMISVLSVFGVAAVILGLYSIARIRRNPSELTGIIAAYFGVAFGSVVFVASVALHVFIYMTEVPEGYARVTFAQLQPDKEHPELPISPLSLELDGQQIFIKGYVHPGVSGQRNVRSFVLVRDMGTCCFGGQPELTDMIEVTLREPLSIRYSTRRRKLGGVLTVSEDRKKIGGIDGGYYKLDADHLE